MENKTNLNDTYPEVQEFIDDKTKKVLQIDDLVYAVRHIKNNAELILNKNKSNKMLDYNLCIFIIDSFKESYIRYAYFPTPSIAFQWYRGKVTEFYLEFIFNGWFTDLIGVDEINHLNHLKSHKEMADICSEILGITYYPLLCELRTCVRNSKLFSAYKERQESGIRIKTDESLDPLQRYIDDPTLPYNILINMAQDYPFEVANNSSMLLHSWEKASEPLIVFLQLFSNVE